jgi:hypothetical protein
LLFACKWERYYQEGRGGVGLILLTCITGNAMDEAVTMVWREFLLFWKKKWADVG